jgi:hypothetical protein
MLPRRAILLQRTLPREALFNTQEGMREEVGEERIDSLRALRAFL